MEQQYKDTQWFLRQQAGGHMIGAHWSPVWRGEGAPDRASMPPHGTVVHGLAVLSPVTAKAREASGCGHMEF